MRTLTFFKRYIGVFSVGLLLISLLIFFHFKGVIFYDEGYILSSAMRVAMGEVPYRDFDMVYTPVSYLATGIFMKIFGVSIFSGRLTALVISLFSLWALYSLMRLITKNNWLILATVLFFLAWGPAHINFPWPAMFSACFLLYTLLFFAQGAKEKNFMKFFLTGVMTVLVFLSKQNFGAMVFLTALLSFFFLPGKNRLKFLKFFLGGAFSASLIALILFTVTSSLIPFWDNMIFYTFKRILVEKTLNTPFLYEGPLFMRFLKLIFYTLPLIFSVFVCFLSRREKGVLWAVGIITAGFYLIGIRPETDYDHFVPLLSVSGLTLAIVIQKLSNFWLKYASFLFMTALVILGFYTAYFNGYYKWEIRLKDQNVFVSGQGIFLAKETAWLSGELAKYIDRKTTKNEYIFVNYYTPLVYLLAGRKNATRFDFTSYSTLGMQKEIIGDLQKKKVRMVVMHTFADNENPLVGKYVKKNYRLGKTIGDYLLYERQR